MQFATLLTPEQVQRAHDASLEILQNVGLLVRSEKARAIFSQHGCSVDAETPSQEKNWVHCSLEAATT